MTIEKTMLRRGCWRLLAMLLLMWVAAGGGAGAFGADVPFSASLPTSQPRPVTPTTMQAGPLAFRAGPILGCAGTDYLTVACRTSRDAVVKLKIDGRTIKSERGMSHRFKVDGLTAGKDYDYSLTAEGDREHAGCGPFTAHTLPSGEKLTFAVFGDSRSQPLIWEKAAAAVLQARPDFCVLVGDYVTDGHYDTWDAECLDPARAFFAAIPSFAVMGNHEAMSPIFDEVFVTPSGTPNWTARIGAVCLIGVNGRLKFEEGDSERKWFEEALKQSDGAPYVFFATHYPAWSSTKYAKVDQYGMLDRDVKRSRDYFLPLLVEHKATAMLCGHAHGYERCEPPGGVTQITSAGGGAPLHRKSDDAEKFNPWSKAFVSTYNYTLITIDGTKCHVKAYDLDGKMIDECELKARSIKP